MDASTMIITTSSPITNLPPSPLPTPDRGSLVSTAVITFLVLCMIIVPARFWVRAKIVGSIGLDDWCIGAATLLSVVLCATKLMEVKYGCGRHIQDIPPKSFWAGMKWNYVSQCLILPAQAFVRISIALFLMRIAAKPIYRRICIVLSVFIMLYATASALTVVFQCRPVQSIWNPALIPTRTCLAVSTSLGLSFTNSIIGILTDVFLVMLPVPMLWNVQVPWRQRTVVCGILGLGLFATAASIAKTSYILDYGKTGDFMWDTVNLGLWAHVEISVGIISASMPALKPLFRRVLEGSSFMSSDRRNGRTDESSYGHQLSSMQSKARGMQVGVTNDIRANNRANHGAGFKRGEALSNNESEEEIMGVMKTTNVRVDFEQISNLSSSADDRINIEV